MPSPVTPMPHTTIPDRIGVPSLPYRPVIAIIGGGLAGAAVAYHLSGLVSPKAAEIVVLEPRAELGRGLAYSTDDPEHRLNVPDNRMSLSPSDPGQFRRWLASANAPALPAGSTTPRGDVFAPRAVFGHYLAEMLAPLLASGAFRHKQDAVIAAERSSAGYDLRLASGAHLRADILVLAATHPKPGLPAELAGLAQHEALIPDAFAGGALEKIGPQGRVLIVGCGLTSADVVATLYRRGHSGPVQIISRRGLQSQPHGPLQAETTASFLEPAETTALGLLRRVRAALAVDAAAGLTWHPVFDRLRAQGSGIWAALPHGERRRFLRHLRGLWDAHRFRIAPQTFDILRRMEAAGRLTYLAGRVSGLRTGGASVGLTLRQSDGQTAQVVADHVVLATGPAHAQVTSSNPVLADLARQGVIQADSLGLGLATSTEGQAIGQQGVTGDIFISGPLARGTVGELMGAPEVTRWAEHVARGIAKRVEPADWAQTAAE